MARILVNGMKSKVGGGKGILDSYLTLLKESRPSDSYYILTPDKEEYAWCESRNITVIDIPALFKNNFMFLILYYIIMPGILRKYSIDAILNFGDIVIPTDIPQLYNFDWAFAVYPDSASWNRMGGLELLFFRIKLFFFKKYIHRSSIVMAQTDVMAGRLRSIHGLNNVVLVPNAVSIDNIESEDARAFNLPKASGKLLYLANYYPHKNFEVLLSLSAIIRERGLPYCIITTLDPAEHEGAKAFLDKVAADGLEGVIMNVGRVAMPHVPSLFAQCDALLMPTLLETFGSPYVEAMHHRRAILTSDLDFARCVCGDAAYYFDPMDPRSILAQIEVAFGDEEQRHRKIAIGATRLAGMWTWPQVFRRYQELLGELCGTAKS